METAPAPEHAMDPAASVPSDATPPLAATQAPRVVQDTLIGPTMSLQACENDTHTFSAQAQKPKP